MGRLAHQTGKQPFKKGALVLVCVRKNDRGVMLGVQRHQKARLRYISAPARQAQSSSCRTSVASKSAWDCVETKVEQGVSGALGMQREPGRLI